eukprot:scaffold66209_cov18-Prasinocladus_malaysianus.AAC.1
MKCNDFPSHYFKLKLARTSTSLHVYTVALEWTNGIGDISSRRSYPDISTNNAFCPSGFRGECGRDCFVWREMASCDSR